MNRDELLAACFPDVEVSEGDLMFEELDEHGRNVLAHVDLSYRRVIVWRTNTDPGPGAVSATETLSVAAIANVCTDPDHRSLGYATNQLTIALAEAAKHPTVHWAAVFAPEEMLPFFARLDFAHPDGAPEGFLLAGLRHPVIDFGTGEFTGELHPPVSWPDGRVDTRGRW